MARVCGNQGAVLDKLGGGGHRGEGRCLVGCGLVIGWSPRSLAVFSQLYGRLYRVVEPKRIRMNAALAQLQEKQAALAEAQEKLREVSFPLAFWSCSFLSSLPSFPTQCCIQLCYHAAVSSLPLLQVLFRSV